MNQETTKIGRGRASTAKKDNEVIIKVANTFIKLGETYEVIPKKDVSAPDGMQEKGTTKFLNEGVKEIRAVYYDESRRAYDTGFYKQSLSNSNMLKADEQYIDAYNKHIREPYEKMFNVDCSETNTAFWDNYRYEVRTNKSFKTSDPKDLFDLFHALMQVAVCEPNEKDSTLQKARYNIRNLEVEKSVEDQRLEDKFKAVADFMVLTTTDQDKLYTVLEWMQMPSVRTSTIEVLRPTVMRFFDDKKTGYEFARRFSEGLKMYETDHGKRQMEYFSIAQKLMLKNIIEKRNGVFYLEGEILGNTPQEISQKALNNTELAEKLEQNFKKINSK